MAETDSEPKSKDDVYRERNRLALAFIQMHLRANMEAKYVGNGEYEKVYPDHGWWPDTDDVNDSVWAVVWVDTPEGQMGWHIPMGMVPEWMPKADPEYDGYTTEEKYARLLRYMEGF